MPICIKCEVMQSSAEMRMSKAVATKGEWVCKDKETCKKRRKEKRAHHPSK